ncbi:MAG: M23 family metallopeptidase [Saprospiraceae bacterium]|nr:M23 family metallopeptidase [Saprospiraceae bacterium]
MFPENEQPKSRWERLKERLRHTYRLVIMNNETFEEVGSYRISLLNVYVLISTELVVVAFMVYAAIAYTPIQRYLPGFSKSEEAYEMENLQAELKELEKQVTAYELYTQNLKKAVTGDMSGITADEVPEMELDTADIEEVSPSELDEQIRKEVELEELGLKAQQPRMSNFSPQGIPIEQLYFTSPVRGGISAGFDKENGHLGVDILAPKNTAIKAVMDGYVFLSDWTIETGNTIGIQHPNNIITFYKHNSALLKKVGSSVKAGEAVAIIGNTGTLTDGPHLHFELWYQGRAIDPTEYIRF